MILFTNNKDFQEITLSIRSSDYINETEIKEIGKALKKQIDSIKKLLNEDISEIISSIRASKVENEHDRNR
ncbi:MAG: hypothetical protein PHW82_16485 [Bacteroidales bacterium]|nr:hypothetical protein [Bacteroidales bacterium]